MVHSERRKAQLAAAGIESVMGDFDNPESMERALEGVEKAYLVCTPDEKLVQRETAFINAAKKAGVQLIVKCSALLAGPTAETQNLRSHGVVEEALIKSGIAYTILRPTGYMQTFTLFGWDMIQKAGVISMPAGDGRMAMVDVRDVATVAIKALTEPGHTGKAYDITGAEAFNLYEMASDLQKALGHSVTYLPGNEQQLTMVMRVLGVPPTPSEHVIKIFRMQREHRIEMIHTTLQELGITPITYAQFARDLVAGRTGGGNSFQPPDTFMVRLMNAMMPTMMKMQLAFSGAKKTG